MLAKMKVALIQIKSGMEKAANGRKVEAMIDKAVRNIPKPDLVILPECFASPYGTQYFQDYAEGIPGPTSHILSAMASKHKVNIIGGSIIEKDQNNIFNTCTVWDRTGTMVAKYRKLHLFDIDVPGKITFKESDVLTAGNTLATVTLDNWKIGLGICYDARFAELARIYAEAGCQLLVYPGAFNMTTGPAHWELLARARAVDNQVYVAFCSIARDTAATYTAWGHSVLVDPWGQVIASAKEDETILQAEISTERLSEVRKQVPITNQRRLDLYTLAAQTNHTIVNCD